MPASGNELGLRLPDSVSGAGQLRDNCGRTLHVAPRPSFVAIHRLGALGGRVERLEVSSLHLAVLPATVGGGLDDRTVHGVLTGWVAGKRGATQKLALQMRQGQARAALTVASLRVRVPVLSLHRTVIEAMS